MKGSFSSTPGLRSICAAAALLASVFVTAPVTAADRRPPPSPWHGDIHRFHEHDWNVWRGGHWIHGRHDGRIGWWWVAGGLWYFYPAPVYPYPSPWEPPPVVLATPPATTAPPPPATQYWYYCEASKSYYPYVATCPGGWKQVPATPSAEAPK
jgi:hypothetical protein